MAGNNNAREMVVQITADISQLQSRMRQLGTIMNTTGTNAQKPFDKLGKAWDNISTAMVRQAKIAGLAIAGGLAAGVVSATNAAREFEQGLANVKSVSGATAAQMAALKEEALKLGASSKYSATQVTTAQEEMIKAGLNVDQVLKQTNDTLSLATAGDLELADAAEIAGIALNSFKKENLNMKIVADQMAGAANASATSVQELKYGFSASSAVAAGLNVKFNDLNTTLAVFANSGLKGSDAGTSLKTMLLRLQPTTKAAYAEFERLGLLTRDTGKGMQWLADNGIKPASNSWQDIEKAMKSHIATQLGVKETSSKVQKEFNEQAMQMGVISSAFFDANGQIKSQAEVAEILKKATEGLTDAQKQMSFNTMFGSDAIRAANIYANEGAAGFNKMAKEITKVSAADVAATKLNTVNGAIESMSGSLETFKISIGDKFLPVLKTIALGLQDMVNGFQDNKEINKFADNLAKVMEAAGPKVVKALEKITMAIVKLGNFMIENWDILEPILAGMVAGFYAFKILAVLEPIIAVYNTLAAISAGVTTAWGVAMAFLASPIFLIALAIGALVAIGIVLYKNWDTVSAFLKKSWEATKDVAIKTWGAIKDFFSGLWDGTKEVAISTWNSITEGLTSAWNSTKEVANTTWTAITSGIMAVWTPVKDFLLGIWNAISEAGAFLWGRLQNSWDVFASYFFPVFQTLWGAISSWFSAVIGTFQTIVSTVWETIKIYFGTVLGVIYAIFTGQWDKIGQVIQIGIGLMRDKIQEGWNKISALWQTAWNAIVSFVQAGWDYVKWLFTSAWDGIKAAIKFGWQAMQIIFTTYWNAIINGVVASWNWISNLFSTSVNGLKKLISDGWTNMKKSFTDGLNNIKDGALNAWNNIKSSFSNGASEAKNKVSNMIDDIKSFFKSLPGNLKQAGIDTINGFINGVLGMAGTLKSKIEKFVSDNIPKPIKDVLGIASPSKLLKQYGKWSMEGYAIGVDNEAGTVQKAIKGVMEGVTATAKAGLTIDPSGLSAGIDEMNAQARNSFSVEQNKEMAVYVTLEGDIKDAFYTKVKTQIAKDTGRIMGGRLPR